MLKESNGPRGENRGRAFLALRMLACLLVFAVALAGCQPIEQTARDVIAGAQGFIEQAQKNHLVECRADPTKEFPCRMINRAVAAQNLAVDALAVYCGFAKDTPPNIPCRADKSAAATLKAALDNLNRIISDYKEASK
jgi:hypothetical protein